MSENLFRNDVIFITGGTGSFGKFFTSEVLKKGAKKVIIFSRDEDKQNSMRFDFKKYESRLEFIIGDVRDKDSLKRAVHGAKIDLLVHAAALKQIPSTEGNILEAVKTNILGTQNVVDVCIEEGIPKAVAISTDKTVEPVNAYGMTKGLAERIFILANKTDRSGKSKFACVRYGNVVNSRGSIIPLFTKQLEKGIPLTVTKKEMTRFILTLKEASNLVFTAITKMKGGEIFVPKIKPIKIVDLAETMIENFGNKKTKIIEVGIRPGEKIHESLISSSEWAYTEDKKDYFVIHPQIKIKGIGLKISKYSSDQGPFLSKANIRLILKSEGVIK